MGELTPESDSGWGLDDDPWAGMVDEGGHPFDIEAADVAVAAELAEGATSPRLFNLPEEFWGARDLFKVVRQQARADGTGPDAVLGAVLARASAMISPDLKFDSGKIGGFNFFANIVAPSGIGKTEAMRSAQRLLLPASHLTDGQGEVDPEKFRDGWSLGSGEGMAEAYMGMIEKDTGEFHLSGKQKGDPKTKSVKGKVRDNVFLFLDEGEALVKMMRERRGATVGQAIRTMWTGMGTGAANASETTTRHLSDGTYSLGLLIGWQPEPAQALISDVGGGTPQRFIWMSGLDPDMPEDPDVRPEPIRLPICDGHGHPVRGMVHFPREVKRALRLRLVSKHVGDDEVVDDLNSHEPLMRCKLAALLCVLDGRMAVNEDDWRFGGMIWQVSCAVRDRLVQFGRQQAERQREAEQVRHAELAAAGEAARIEVSERVSAYARQIAARAREAEAAAPFATLGRSDERRRIKSALRQAWDAGLEYALARGWVVLVSDGARIAVGDSSPT
ncbi:MAG: hypothetical protein ABW046_14110 [Actinoplanes sp.]